MLPQLAGNAFQEFVAFCMDFYATRKKLFLMGKNVLILKVPIFDK